jgi:hypothetical protein
MGTSFGDGSRQSNLQRLMGQTNLRESKSPKVSVNTKWKGLVLQRSEGERSSLRAKQKNVIARNQRRRRHKTLVPSKRNWSCFQTFSDFSKPRETLEPLPINHRSFKAKWSCFQSLRERSDEAVGRNRTINCHNKGKQVSKTWASLVEINKGDGQFVRGSWNPWTFSNRPYGHQPNNRSFRRNRRLNCHNNVDNKPSFLRSEIDLVFDRSAIFQRLVTHSNLWQ